MTTPPLLFMCLLATLSLHAQFYYDFKQVQDIQSIGFVGDNENFILDEGKLRLNATETGNSKIFLKSNIPDSVEFGLDFKLDFSPSVNNKLRIYLHIDTFQLDMASGYFIEIGENGSDDKLKFNRIVNGDVLTIAEGSLGLFASDPVECNLKIQKDSNGFWQFYIRKNEEEVFNIDLELFDSTIKRYFDQYFGIECIYTATRKDKFYFEKMYLREIIPDQKAPQFKSYEMLDEFTMEVTFDEILDKNAVKNASNYFWLEEALNPVEIGFNDFRPNKILLTFDKAVESTSINTLEIRNLADLQGNALVIPIEIKFYRARYPQMENELLINEILFDPIGEGNDFLELYNNSGEIISLKNLEISNQTRENSVVLNQTSYDIFPDAYMIFCRDTGLLNEYELPLELNFIPVDLPAFNNDIGNATIKFFGNVIDSFDYDESMHFELIDDTEGISLERLSHVHATNEESNWHSAADFVGGATPGRENSQFLIPIDTEDALFAMQTETFSPDNDGFQDQMIISYSFKEQGIVGSAIVFDLHGRYVDKIVNNKLLGSSGLISWDGISTSGTYLPIGPYIVVCSVFNESGWRYEQKLLTYLVEGR